MMTTAGIDLARNVFQVHPVDQHGKVALKRLLKRGQMAEFFVHLPVCLTKLSTYRQQMREQAKERKAWWISARRS